MLSKESLASLDTLISSVKDSIGSIPREKEAEVILKKEDWSHHGWYLWKMVEQERRRLEEENRKLTRTIFELQQKLDDGTERKKPVMTDFTSLASEIQKMMGLFSKVEIDDVCVDNSDCKEDRTIHWSNKPDDQSNSLH